MTDYDVSTGASGTMRIRDLGSVVEFWLKSGFSSSFFGSATFNYTSPNGSGSFAHGYASGNTWQKMGQITVTTGGTVSWTLPSTGTSAMGGPTTQSQAISRATVPPAPKINGAGNGLDQITHTGMRYRFTSNGTGGSPIIRWEYQVSLSSAFTGASWVTTSGTVTRSDLIPGKKYYWRARGVNALGAGPPTPQLNADTFPPVWVKIAGAWKRAIPWVKIGGVWKAAIAWVKIGGVWKKTTG